MIEQVVVTDAWLEHEGQLLLNPALKPYEQDLLKMRQIWSKQTDMTPLSWYAGQVQQVPAALVVSIAESLVSDVLPKDAKQFWLASPYHARLTRSELRVMPESMLDWSAQVGQQVCDTVNPLLAEDGLELFMVDDILMLASQAVWQVDTPDFAQISGKNLPNQHQEGKDAGRWSRLLTEVQMTLHQHQIFTENAVQIHGLWFWGQTQTVPTLDATSLPTVASRNTYLNAVLSCLDKQQHAKLIVSEAEHLPQLLPKVLPKHWQLLGAGRALTLQTNMFAAALAKVKKPTWKGM